MQILHELMLRNDLKQFNPSHFQNIILGVLAIFIPFAIVFLTDVLNSKETKRSKFEKMVLNDEVFNTKRVFWLSIFGIVFFAFFSDSSSNGAKLSSLLVAFGLIISFWVSFSKLLRFSEGDVLGFEKSFLRKLAFSKGLRFQNKQKSNKRAEAWHSFWSEKTERDEREFTEIFISHIDEAMKLRRFEYAINLAGSYKNNIEKRHPYFLLDILPKLFEWDEMLWNIDQIRMREYEAKEKAGKKIQESSSKSDFFWKWHYFRGEFFQAIIKALVKIEYRDGCIPYAFFDSFQKHVLKIEAKLREIRDEKESKSYKSYGASLFLVSAPSFLTNWAILL